MHFNKISLKKYVFSILIVSFFFIGMISYKLYMNLQFVVKMAIPHHLISTCNRFQVPITEVSYLIPWLETRIANLSVIKGMQLLNSIDNGKIGKILLSRGIEVTYSDMFSPDFQLQLSSFRKKLINNSLKNSKEILHALSSAVLLQSDWEEDFLSMKIKKKQMVLNTSLTKVELESVLSKIDTSMQNNDSAESFSMQLKKQIELVLN